jgi:hypothetical protein
MDFDDGAHVVLDGLEFETGVMSFLLWVALEWSGCCVSYWLILFQLAENAPSEMTLVYVNRFQYMPDLR